MGLHNAPALRQADPDLALAAADALRRIDAANITLSGLTIREPSLDDVFLNLTGHKAEDPAPSDDDVTATSQSRKASS